MVGSAWLLLFGLAFLALSGHAGAQQVEAPPTWGGDVFSRPRLTSNWGGLRDLLGEKGVTFDIDLMTTPQVVTSGGRSSGGAF